MAKEKKEAHDKADLVDIHNPKTGQTGRVTRKSFEVSHGPAGFKLGKAPEKAPEKGKAPEKAGDKEPPKA